jgi:hypothetical protein
LHGLEEVADMAARLAGRDVAQPGGIGFGVGGGDDFHAVAIFQFAAQGHELKIDFDRDATIADVGMHAVGEVHRRRSARQGKNFAFGREHVDLIGEQIDLEMLQEFRRVAALTQTFQQVLQPLMRLLMQVVDILVAALVQPMRSHARIGDFVHLVGTDLNFYRRAERPE